MRRNGHWFGCLLGAVLLLAGCQGTEEPLTTVEGPDWREETPRLVHGEHCSRGFWDYL